jgi:CRISPR-associated protein Cas6/Cse3/CasE subtype I-E
MVLSEMLACPPTVRLSRDRGRRPGGFVHSVLSFTRLEIPEVELFETAVTFPAATDPLTAHDELAKVFGHKAGFGHFLFRADSSVPGRYWVQSVEPWSRWPEQALSALEPKRVVIQLAEGLMYRFTLPVCAGREFVQDKEKRVVPYETADEVRAWFNDNAAQFGIKPLMLDVSMRTLRFPHRDQRFKVQHAVLEGALEVAHAERLRRRILKGFGYYRRTGLGMLQLSA